MTTATPPTLPTPPESETTDAPAAAPTERWWRRAPLAFFAVALVSGIGMAVILPPLGGYDEPVHFMRAWQISDGGLFASAGTTNEGRGFGGDAPASIVVDLGGLMRDGVFASENEHSASSVWSHIDDPAPHGHATFVSFPSTAVYAPAPYLPAAFALRIGRALGLSAFMLVLLARLAGIVAYAALGALAVHRIPARKWLLAVVLLAPVAVFQAATISADALTIALALLVVADALALSDRTTDAVRPALLIEVGVVTLALALAKQPYFMVAALLLIPAWRHRGRVAATLGAILVAAGGIALAWSTWAQAHYIPPDIPVAYLGHTNYAYRDVDTTAQLEYVRGHPWSFLRAIGETLGYVPGSLAHDVVAQASWWRVPTIVAVLAAVLLIGAAFVDARPLPAARAFAIMGGALALVMTLTIFLLAYTGWNAVRAPRIDAFQGRYLFPPLALVLLLVLPARRAHGGDRRARLGPLLVCASALVLLTVEIGLAYFFYA